MLLATSTASATAAASAAAICTGAAAAGAAAHATVGLRRCARMRKGIHARTRTHIEHSTHAHVSECRCRCCPFAPGAYYSLRTLQCVRITILLHYLGAVCTAFLSIARPARVYVRANDAVRLPGVATLKIAMAVPALRLFLWHSPCKPGNQKHRKYTATKHSKSCMLIVLRKRHFFTAN